LFDSPTNYLEQSVESYSTIVGNAERYGVDKQVAAVWTIDATTDEDDKPNTAPPRPSALEEWFGTFDFEIRREYGVP